MRLPAQGAPFIRNIQGPSTAKQTENISILLSGYWPTPSWSLKEIKIDIDDTKRIVNIELVGTRSPGLAIQVIQEFSEKISLNFQNKGKWRIEAISKDGVRSMEITVI